jgi:nitroimidazol reductase NimA-like FMN-containing flavoprotein (pyridoxamine 5'-phosphate oxidase superfamily)
MTPARHRIRRQPSRGRYDRESIDAALDAGVFAHVAFVDGQQPYCVPMLHARIGDHVLVHGSTASRAIKTLASGVPACLTVTTLHGLVLARSAFEHSANYTSVMLLGSFEPVEEPDFAVFVNKLVPDRYEQVRPPNRKEIKATVFLRMPIDEASVKARSGPPSDDDSEDARTIDAWAGELPIVTAFGEPVPSPGFASS